MTQKIAVVGGGAAGFFGAITIAKSNPNCEVTIYEKTDKLLSKVRISGGGRCNVTHDCLNPTKLIQYYPRGNKKLKSVFSKFGPKETIDWFQSKGVKLKVEADGRIFPISDSSLTIINCLMEEAEKWGVKIKNSTAIERIQIAENQKDRKFILQLTGKKNTHADKLLISTGGNPKYENYNWLEVLGHKIQKPVPSLFTFNVPRSPLKELMGISVPNAHIKIAGQKLESEGPLLITHWGFSGPAVLKLSAWGARILQELNYRFTILINFCPDFTEENLRVHLTEFKKNHPKKIISSNPLFALPTRLWKAITLLAEIDEELKWLDLSTKKLNKLIEALYRCSFEVNGKTTFKEEFVTCGGISLDEVDLSTMESKKIKGLYFAGEVLDIDGVTGGFNFQAAWSTGFLAGKAIAENPTTKH